MDIEIVNKSPHDLPQFATEQSAGVDLRAFLSEPVTLNSLGRTLIPTGLYMALPPGFEAQIRPRSGIAYKQGVTVLNAPGTIDADYRGEIRVLLVNLSDAPVEIHNGDRIAQMVIAKHEHPQWRLVEKLQETSRGAGGFGSTGKN